MIFNIHLFETKHNVTFFPYSRQKDNFFLRNLIYLRQAPTNDILMRWDTIKLIKKST